MRRQRPTTSTSSSTPSGCSTWATTASCSPYTYLTAWRRLLDIEFPDGTGWAPAAAAGSTAPRPGAIVLQVSDISSASGLKPGSVARAFVAPASAEGDGSLVRAFTPPPEATGSTREGLGD